MVGGSENQVVIVCHFQRGWRKNGHWHAALRKVHVTALRGLRCPGPEPCRQRGFRPFTTVSVHIRSAR